MAEGAVNKKDRRKVIQHKGWGCESCLWNDKSDIIYAADTSGVCSALYELGGMTVVHDASGCNSTYATHDEPRWYDRKSMISISALTEADAVMGNDGKFIRDVAKASGELSPNS